MLVVCLFGLASVAAAQTQSAAPNSSSLPELASNELSDIGLELTTANKGFIVSMDKQLQLDSGAVRVNFETVGQEASRADVMRVVLQAISKLAPYHPTLLVFARTGQERLLLDGKDVPDISFEYDHDKPLPAWRLFAERAAKPDGSKIKLPDGLLARTTASFALASELMQGGTANGHSTPGERGDGKQDEKLIRDDSWHPTSAGEHGEVVAHILASVRATPLSIKDGSRLEYQQVEKILSDVNDAVGKALTNAKIVLQRREQGGTEEVPDGSSELLELQLKFSDIFAVTDDNVLIPVTENLAYMAPESTFAGLTVYGKHREAKTRVIGKTKVWNYSAGHGYYRTYLETDKSRMLPVMNAIMLRWGDIKDKIAIDFSTKKSEEDSDMERRALNNAS